MKQLEGKLAWVTGAGSGIGAASALALAAAGARVVLTGRRAEPLEAVASRIRQVDFAVAGDARADHRWDVRFQGRSGTCMGRDRRRAARSALINKRTWRGSGPSNRQTASSCDGGDSLVHRRLI